MTWAKTFRSRTGKLCKFAIANGNSTEVRAGIEKFATFRPEGATARPPSLFTFEPLGAFYAFPKIAVTGLDDEAFAQMLLEEEKVAVIPGSAFGVGGEGFVRCSYATAYEKIEEALFRIERFMHRHG